MGVTQADSEEVRGWEKERESVFAPPPTFSVGPSPNPDPISMQMLIGRFGRSCPVSLGFAEGEKHSRLKTL